MNVMHPYGTVMRSHRAVLLRGAGIRRFCRVQFMQDAVSIVGKGSSRLAIASS